MAGGARSQRGPACGGREACSATAAAADEVLLGGKEAWADAVEHLSEGEALRAHASSEAPRRFDWPSDGSRLSTAPE